MRRSMLAVLSGLFFLAAVGFSGCGGSQQAEQATPHKTPDQSVDNPAEENPSTGTQATEQTGPPTAQQDVTPQPQTLAASPKSLPNKIIATPSQPRQAIKKRHTSTSAARPKSPVASAPSYKRAMSPSSPKKATEKAILEVLESVEKPSEELAPAAAPQLSVSPNEEPKVAAVPRMATAAREPLEGVELSAESTDSTAEDSTAESSDKSTMVTVFYGTDRKEISGGAAATGSLNKIPWGHLTAVSGGITLLLLLVLCFARRSKFVRAATAITLLATVGLGVCMFQIPRNTKPSTADTNHQYGNERGHLVMGTCEVSIPKDHEVGKLESPSILRLEFNEDPEKHVVLMDVEPLETATFYNQLNERIDQSDGREAFVFVHGFNVTFENAARRTAQLAHDLHFDGAPIFYSWPSQGGLLQYTVDEENVVWTVPHLREFLLGVAEKTKAKRIHLIAHSMGNRALTSALERLSRERQGEKPLFHEVLLTAPDIDAEVFRRDIAPAIVQTASRVTLYASSHDTALAASRKVHGGHPRAGESGENLVVIPGIDTIDVSAVDTSLMGHSYYGDSDTVLVDMAQLLHDQKPPNLRDRLQSRVRDTLQYWVFLAKQMSMRPETSTK